MGEEPGGPRLIVDAMNVIGSRPDGWWRDREGAKARLAARLGRLALEEDGLISVVYDGKPIAGLPEGRSGPIEVVYADRPGPNAADDRIVELVADRPEGVVVVTSDRTLVRRVAELGAESRGASWLWSRLDRLDRAGSEDQGEGKATG
ncbi:NYN domain-containing protein [Tautonia sociabilis]|uniref:RNA-binding protein n=1 Tax=Tautonia sociabilis TaxID=2080755 RepID=A0A432MI93_9BACT|nr:NYN domain-containing protein [Tautonia sociabilis]RUL86940.1 RNA-binding protein [Tautonia sociabilis]